MRLTNEIEQPKQQAQTLLALLTDLFIMTPL